MVSTIKAHFLHELESIFLANQLHCCHVVMQSSLMAIRTLPLMLRPEHSSSWQGHKYMQSLKKYSKESFATNLFSLIFVQVKTMTRELRLRGSDVYWEKPIMCDQMLRSPTKLEHCMLTTRKTVLLCTQTSWRKHWRNNWAVVAEWRPGRCGDIAIRSTTTLSEIMKKQTLGLSRGIKTIVYCIVASSDTVVHQHHRQAIHSRETYCPTGNIKYASYLCTISL